MKIAFISANRETIPHPAVPIGLLSLMANTPERHARVLWDLCFEAQPLERVRDGVAAFAPDAVAVGLRNIESLSGGDPGRNAEFYSRIMRTLRAATPAPIILGGSGFSVLPENFMRLLKPDFGISGEGEAAFPLLIENLESKQPNLDAVAGLRYYQGERLRLSPAAGSFLRLEDCAPPDRSLADSRYYSSCGIEPIQTKRGCPLKCAYCTYPLIEGRLIRMRAPDAVAAEMIRALETRPEISHFFIVDSVFNLPPEHAKAVCREMIRRKFNTPWTCYISPLGFDRELAGLLAQAACAGIEVGSDSGCDAILEKLGKGFRTGQIRALHRLCAEAGIPDCHSFILGTPGETLAQLDRTLDFIIELDPHSAVLMFATDFRDALDPALTEKRRALRAPVEARVLARKDEFAYWIIPALGVNFDPAAPGGSRRGLSAPPWQYIRYTGMV